MELTDKIYCGMSNMRPEALEDYIVVTARNNQHYLAFDNPDQTENDKILYKTLGKDGYLGTADDPDV